MFFFTPVMAVVGIYVLAAILPAAFLMRYIYRRDHVEKEPAGLLVSLIFAGILAALASIVLETVGNILLNLLVDPRSPAYVILLAFLVVAAVEEGTKLFFLKRRSWNAPAFNYRFDGIVYAVFTSLGFAAFENIKYVMNYGLSVALPRAVLAVPGHTGFAVFMGLFYSRAKICRDRGDTAGMTANLILGYLSAVLLHGFYDACAMSGTALAALIFLLFVGLMYFVVIRLVRRESYSDRPV